MKETSLTRILRRRFWVLASWPFLLAAAAYCGAATAERARTIEITRKDPKFAGYELGDVAPRDFVRLKLTVKDVDTGADFVPRSGRISSIGGVTAWKEKKDEQHVYEAQTFRFQRRHRLYVAYARGQWTAPPGVAGKAPIWEVDVFQVRIDTSPGYFPKYNKLLATAGHPLTATLHVLGNRTRPSGTVAWSHPLVAATAFVPQALKTTFTAPAALTPAAQEDSQYAKVTFTPTNGKVSSDSHPLNITAPQLFKASRKDGIISTVTTAWIDSRNPKPIALINGKQVIFYWFYDQFGKDRITRSDAGKKPGERHVQAREDVPWSGPRSEAIEWAKKEVKTTTAWFNVPGGFVEDKLQLPLFPTSLLIDPTTVPDPEHPDRKPKFNLTRDVEALAVRNHVQRASVDGSIDTEYTANVLSLVVTEYTDAGDHDRMRLKCTYELKVTRKK